MLALFPVNARIHAVILTVLQFFNYSCYGYFQKKTGTVSNTIKGRCSLGYKRGHSAVCRYFTHNAIPHAHGAPKLQRTAFNDKRGTNEGCFNSLKQREQRRERLLRPVCRAFCALLRDKRAVKNLHRNKERWLATPRI